jgi:hypothetical protein
METNLPPRYAIKATMIIFHKQLFAEIDYTGLSPAPGPRGQALATPFHPLERRRTP